MAVASVKSNATWKKYPHFCLGISLGSKNHEGEALEAIVDWLNRAGFSEGRVDFSDTLHRYNVMMDEGLDEHSARKRILEDSDAWITRNHRTLDKLVMPHELISWDRWLHHPKFSAYKAEFERAYQNNPHFRQAILNDVGHYFSRRDDLALSQVEPEKIELSVAFLIEELAAHSILYGEYPCAVVYPGREQESFKLARSGLLKGIPTGMEQSFHTRLVLHKLAPVMPDSVNDNAGAVYFPHQDISVI